MRSTLVFTALAAALALGGCASPVPVKQAPVESKTPTSVESGTAGANANGAGQNQVAAVQAPAESNAGPGPNVPKSVYFAFNSYTVESQYTPVLNANATYLTQHPQAHVQLQGNTDARGSREYNLALGQKRAEAVRRALSLLGVSEAQMEPVSFGEEKPAAYGADEASMAKNRRVELTYR